MTETSFADGIADITVTGGIVRIEFFVLGLDRNSPPKPGENSRMQVSRTITVAMPLAGFATSLKSIDEFKQKLLDAGVLKSTPDAAKEVGADAKPANVN